jgi:hypothetical protein
MRNPPLALLLSNRSRYRPPEAAQGTARPSWAMGLGHGGPGHGVLGHGGLGHGIGPWDWAMGLGHGIGHGKGDDDPHLPAAASASRYLLAPWRAAAFKGPPKVPSHCAGLNLRSDRSGLNRDKSPGQSGVVCSRRAGGDPGAGICQAERFRMSGPLVTAEGVIRHPFPVRNVLTDHAETKWGVMGLFGHLPLGHGAGAWLARGRLAASGRTHLVHTTSGISPSQNASPTRMGGGDLAAGAATQCASVGMSLASQRCRESGHN